jgi:hypothetical protein
MLACFENLGLEKPHEDDGESSRDPFGAFIVCDQGRIFDPNDWGPPDLHDPQVRRRGRGLGLQMIHSSMTRVAYLPQTPWGNLTLLCFDPEKHQAKETISHV